jgi:hypothetical protein
VIGNLLFYIMEFRDEFEKLNNASTAAQQGTAAYT